ncbi:LysE family translocator [uncultured Shewanella sp.]|uniref:LysE family translocator n=1 Tax=uncultured Shewanella sp. TaxID=173975 RepID=UPI00262E204C|nr:LysE family translocator [uncultured Shewanella sp.]
MELQQSLSLLFTMLVLAMVPGPVVFAIISRSFSHGLVPAIQLFVGVLIADYLFICIALFGLTALASVMGTAFVVIKYLSATYLCWLGYQLISSKIHTAEITEITDGIYSNGIKNTLTGLMIGLSNPKAIIFYVGFFPAFVPSSNISFNDAVIVMGIATLAFGSINLCYALMAVKAKKIFSSAKAHRVINRVAGSIMLIAGVLIAVNI